MSDNLLILGRGACGRIAKETALEMGCFGKIDFLDDKNENAIDKISNYKNYTAEYPYAFVALGNAEMKLGLISCLEDACFKIAVLISPKAYVSPSARIMKGTIIEPNATVQSNVTVMTGAIISSGAVLRHDCRVSDGAHCDCNSVVASGVTVPFGAKIKCGEIYGFDDTEKLPCIAGNAKRLNHV